MPSVSARTPKLSFRDGVVLAFFAFISIGNFSVALPNAAPGRNDFFSMLLRWNSRGPKATLMPLWEWIGLHHRWNMFAHSPEDTAHAWYNVKYEIVVSDAAGVKDTFYVPPLNPSLFERYLNYRQFRFKNNFTVVKSAFGVPFSRYWAREYARKYSFVTYPIDVQVQTRFERLNPPGSLKEVGIEQRSIPYSGRFALSDLNCGESPR